MKCFFLQIKFVHPRKILFLLHYYFNFKFIMKTGKVKFFNATKGFGFIKDDATNEEVFVHVTGLVDQIKQDDAVTFDITEGKRGLNAVNVKKA
jgi:CspA family cold shock protein